MSAQCFTCKRAFGENESGWVEDVKVIDIATGRVTLKQEFTCDDCEAKR